MLVTLFWNWSRVFMFRGLDKSAEEAGYRPARRLFVVQFDDFVDVVAFGDDVPELPGVLHRILQCHPVLIAIDGDEDRDLPPERRLSADEIANHALQAANTSRAKRHALRTVVNTLPACRTPAGSLSSVLRC